MDIIVVGSCMIDQICYAPRLPKPGETIHGSKFSLACGGKGANQCVMAARLGAKTAMVANVGGDWFGQMYMDSLHANNVDTSHVTRCQDAATGVAQICVDDTGMNSIVIVAGANQQLLEGHVARAEPLVAAGAHVMLCQLEVPLETTLAALTTARKHGVMTVVNAAPAQPVKQDDLFQLADLFCVNETEAEAMTGLPVVSVDDAEAAARALLGRGCRSVVVTLGSRGAVYLDSDRQHCLHVPADIPSCVVDTTGAGDAFLGALAFFLARAPSLSMEESLRRACAIASDTVTRPGTQDSYPDRRQLPAELLQLH